MQSMKVLLYLCAMFVLIDHLLWAEIEPAHIARNMKQSYGKKQDMLQQVHGFVYQIMDQNPLVENKVKSGHPRN